MRLFPGNPEGKRNMTVNVMEARRQSYEHFITNIKEFSVRGLKRVALDSSNKA